MKTIGYRDLCDGSKIIRIYNPLCNTNLFNKQKRYERIREGLKNIASLGNIAVYLIKGNKYRLLFIKGL